MVKGYYAKNPEACRQQVKNWQSKNPDKILNFILKRNYGITKEQFDILNIKQNGVCAICEQPNVNRFKRLCVDHCHETKRVRGLLCNTCNRGLGMFQDNPKLLTKAIEYLDYD